MNANVPKYVQSGNTLLIIAAWEGHTECVRRLLEGGIDTEATIHVR
jgi:hypothetical protein